MGKLINFLAFRERRAQQRAWDLAWTRLELLELDAKTAHVRSLLALAETDEERDQHCRMLVRFAGLRQRYLREQRRLMGGAG